MKQYKIPSAPYNGMGRVAMVLSRHNKRGVVPDESTPLERSEWIGQGGEIKGQPIVYIDAVKWRGVWYIQYILT